MPVHSAADALPEVGAVRAESLGDLAYRQLRLSILSGQLPPGAELNEVKLSAQLGVSRTPLRDAIRRLEDVGLAETRPRRQARVRVFTAIDFVDIYNTRLALEGAAVRLCAVAGVSLDEPRHVLSQMESVTTTDVDAMAELETAFHFALVEASGNAALIRAYSAIGTQLQTALAANHGAIHRSARAIAESHRAILTAIESGDERTALETVQAHIVDAVESTLTRLEGDGGILLRTTRQLYDE